MDILIFVSEQWILVSVLLALLYVFAWTEMRKGGPNLSTHAATRLINQGNALVVDLRDAKEFKQGHIVDALNVPHTKVNDNLSRLETHKAKTLLLVDKLGHNTASVGKLLRDKGYTVNRLDGGMVRWEQSSLPVVKG